MVFEPDAYTLRAKPAYVCGWFLFVCVYVCAFVCVVASVVLWFSVRASGRGCVRGGLHFASKNGRRFVAQKWTQK